MSKFYSGQKILSVFWDDGETKAGKFGCISIEIVMEAGQLADVPWALAKYEDGRTFKYNLAQVQGVLLS